jgi:hypothetical protein
MNQNWIDPVSGCVVRIECFADTRRTGIAAGFIYKRNSETYLITNWHVASGRDANNPTVSPDGSFTSHIRVHYLEKVGDQILRASKLSQDIKLNDSAGGGLGWFQHTTGSNVDVAAIPLTMPINAGNCSLNDNKFFDRFKLAVSDNVFVLGYPWGVGGAIDMLPIWKGGTVASIPGFDYGGKPCFLIDANTFKGMSGGPVICQYNLGLQTNRIHNHQKETDPVFGTIQYFCGVYSGRARIKNPDESLTETDLGYCWRPELVDQIIDGKVRGSAI